LVCSKISHGQNVSVRWGKFSASGSVGLPSTLRSQSASLHEHQHPQSCAWIAGCEQAEAEHPREDADQHDLLDSEALKKKRDRQDGRRGGLRCSYATSLFPMREAQMKSHRVSEIARPSAHRAGRAKIDCARTCALGLAEIAAISSIFWQRRTHEHRRLEFASSRSRKCRRAHHWGPLLVALRREAG